MKRANVILAYHAIGDCPPASDPDYLFVSTDTFAAQMRYLADTRRTRPLAEVLQEPNSGYVGVTFDDAYRNVLTNAAPILQRYDIPATVFVPTAHLGKPNSWIPRTGCDLEIMNEADLRAAMSIGLDLQSHGHGHLDYSRLSLPDATADIAASMQILESITGNTPRHFAYPWGRYGATSTHAIEESGIDAAFSIYVPADDRVRDRNVPSRYALDRIPVTPLDGMATFRLKLSGHYLSIRRARSFTIAYSATRPLLDRLLKRPRG